jgi:hypothetical protein
MHKAKAVTSRRPDGSCAGAVGGSTSTATSHPAASSPPAGSTPRQTFQFVSALPSSEAERSQNKVLVRSNASNYHWRQHKKSTTTSAATTSPSPSEEQPATAAGRPGPRRRRSTSQQSLSTSSSRRILAPLTPAQIFDSATSVSTEGSERSTPKDENEEEAEQQQDDQIFNFGFNSDSNSPTHSELMVLFPNNSNLSTLVVSGHHDPFETYPCDLPKEFVSPVLDQSK